MSARVTCFVLLLFCVAVPSMPASAQSPAQSYAYQHKRLRNACPPPLKFAAGACLRRCPAGYRDMGGYCRLQSQRF